MKLIGTVKSAAHEGNELVLVVHGWASTDPAGTRARPLGEVRLPLSLRTNIAYHVGRKVTITVEAK